MGNWVQSSEYEYVKRLSLGYIIFIECVDIWYKMWYNITIGVGHKCVGENPLNRNGLPLTDYAEGEEIV